MTKYVTQNMVRVTKRLERPARCRMYHYSKRRRIGLFLPPPSFPQGARGKRGRGEEGRERSRWLWNGMFCCTRWAHRQDSTRSATFSALQTRITRHMHGWERNSVPASQPAKRHGGRTGDWTGPRVRRVTRLAGCGGFRKWKAGQKKKKNGAQVLVGPRALPQC